MVTIAYIVSLLLITVTLFYEVHENMPQSLERKKIITFVVRIALHIIVLLVNAHATGIQVVYG